jgi:hypothetical protein
MSVQRQRADEAGKTLGTLTMETEIRFASAKARQEFAEKLAGLVAGLAMK